LFLVLCFTTASGIAQSRPEFVPFQGAVKGALYKPDSGPAPHVGILVMHRTSNYLAHPACTELSKRGFMLLCMTTRFENNETMVDWLGRTARVRLKADSPRRRTGATVGVPGAAPSHIDEYRVNKDGSLTLIGATAASANIGIGASGVAAR